MWNTISDKSKHAGMPAEIKKSAGISADEKIDSNAFVSGKSESGLCVFYSGENRL